MYHSYFGLEEQAFSIAVNPRYLYMSAQHREALAHLLYGVNSGGFVMLTGEVGTGKTTIIRCLLEQLPAKADVAMVLNPSASARDLLCSICDELGVAYQPDETSLKILTDKLYEVLLRNHSAGRNTIVLIDEAQLLRISTLEQIRLLTNLESNTQKLLQIILVGQPELNELLAKPALRQLSQRITARYHLRPLSVEETDAYIKHRLSVAGMPAGRQIFPAPIIRKVHQISRGIPRLINILCDRMLLGAYSRESTMVDTTICRQATVEVLGEAPKEHFRRYQHIIFGGAAAASMLIAVLFIWYLSDPDEPTAPQQAVAVQQLEEVSPTPTHAVQRTPKDTSEDLWVRSEDHALHELLRAVGLPQDTALYPCYVINKRGYQCETQKVSTWEEFKRINRPAVLTLTTPARTTAYATLVGLSHTSALLSVDGQQKSMSLEQLGSMWTGEFVFVWRRPPSYKEAVGLGMRGEIVAWVAQQFAELDGQSKPLTNEFFNPALQKRVKIFQRSHNLTPDGLVGMQTLLKLNEALGTDKSLDNLYLAQVNRGEG